jgi:hydroxymethylpyrimidine/phosphomethylpyrimidine kinase
MIANILTIAGSDSGGGAGIQADIKTISALGAYAASAITALTAQNTQGVVSWRPVDPEFVGEQIDAVFSDIRIDAVKIGMLGTAEVAAIVAERLARYGAENVVLDPVMVAKGGDRLVTDAAIAVLRARLIPLARVITPNLPEASVLLGRAVATRADMDAAVRDLHRLGPEWVLLKGGHLEADDATDILYDGKTVTVLTAPRIATRNTHGTGCTLSSAIAALLPAYAPVEAVRRAKAYVTEAIRAADELSVGSGHGPLHHFHGVKPG